MYLVRPTMYNTHLLRCTIVFYTLDCIGPATPASVYSYHTPVAAGEVLIPADAVHMAILFKYKTQDS